MPSFDINEWEIPGGRNLADRSLGKICFCNRRNSFLSFGGPQLYYLEALPFTYDQYVVIELSDKLYNCYCLFLCEPMNFHPEKQFFQVASARDRTTDTWITKQAIYLYTMGDPLARLLF